MTDLLPTLGIALSLAGLAWIVAGYPAWLWLRLKSRAAKPIRHGGTPAVTLIIVVADEAARIEARLENLLALDYPRDRLEILVVSDGSRDATARLVHAFGKGVQVIERAERRGKPTCLALAARKAKGEILAFADARQRFGSGTLRALVAPFADPSVGAVGGELLQRPADSAVGEGLSLYRRYDCAVRRLESELDSTVGVSGAVWAIRRELFEPLPADTILDDVALPLRVVRRGLRVLHEPTACAFDVAPVDAKAELDRKARTLAGCFQLLVRERWLLNPRKNRIWLQTLSHKFARLALPLLLATLLFSTAAARGRAGMGLLLYPQIGFVLAGSTGLAFRGRTFARALAAPAALLLLAVAATVGLARFAAGKQPASWKGTPRE